MLSVFLHQALFFCEILGQELLSIIESILQLSDLNRCDVTEHLLVLYRDGVPLMVEPDADGLGQSCGIAPQWMHTILRTLRLSFILVDVASGHVCLRRTNSWIALILALVLVAALMLAGHGARPGGIRWCSILRMHT